MTKREPPARLPGLTILLLCLACMPAAAAGDSVTSLRRAVAAACDAGSSDAERIVADIPGGTIIAAEPLLAQGMVIGQEQRFGLPDGSEIRIHRVAPGGQLLRISAEYWMPNPDGGVRPRLAVITDASCSIRIGRRLLYHAGSPQPDAIEHLDESLAFAGVLEPLNPPVPEGIDPGGVPVALVDAGVNYLLPEIGRRLARGGDGKILGGDYWDLDGRPFDANPARSPFFPQHHGTRTASLLLREAPAARLVPYRYPRPDMSRMTRIVQDAAASGVKVVNMSMGSDDVADWEAFAAAARAHPRILFVLSAGNDGRDIDAQPVYPAALRLDNAITVTSSEDNGELAPGSNHGSRSVDLLVPAERLAVTDFDGNRVPASGSSYAAVRISALAARMLAAHPDWGAPELKTAISARTLPPLPGVAAGAVARGFIPRPDKAERLPPMADGGEVKEVARRAFDAGDIYPGSGKPPRHDYLLTPTFILFRDAAWTIDDLKQNARQAAEILGQCGIAIPHIDVRVLEGPAAYHYFHDAIAKELVRRMPPSRLAVYFVRDTLQADAYDAEAIGRSNSATRPELRDTIWVTEDTRDPGVALAHELSHIVMDSGRHVETSGNLMSAETAPGNTVLTPAQCEALARAGTAHGLLAPATAGSDAAKGGTGYQ